MSYSETVIFGCLAKDPEMRYMPDGTAITSFSIPINRQYTTHGEEVKETTWYRVSIFGKRAEACNDYLRKGSEVLVIGSLKPDPETGGPRIWTGQDGAARASYEIIASTVNFGRKPDGGGAKTAKGRTPEENGPSDEAIAGAFK